MKYIFLFFLLQSCSVFAQMPSEPIGITLLKMDIKEYYSPINEGGGSNPFGGSNYKGSLKKVIVSAWHLPLTRIRFNKEPPLRYISFETFSSKNPAYVHQLIQQNLQVYFGFKVIDGVDSIDTWVIRTIDRTKLVPFNPDDHGGYGGWGECADGESWEADGAPISEIAKEYERISGNISVFEGDNEGIYSFDIPYSFMKSPEGFNVFLKKFIGLEIKKEKRPIAVKYVNFD